MVCLEITVCREYCRCCFCAADSAAITADATAAAVDATAEAWATCGPYCCSACAADSAAAAVDAVTIVAAVQNAEHITQFYTAQS